MDNRKKLLLVGPSQGSIHLKNYFHLIKDYFDEILIVSGAPFMDEETVICDFSLKNPFKVLNAVKKIKKAIVSFNPTVIHVHQANSYAFITAMANKKGIPFVVTTWGSDVLVLPKKGLLYRLMVKFSLSRADYITADASHMIQAIRKLGIKQEVILANFGIEILPNINTTKQNIIYSNRLHNPLYNIETIIKGFAQFFKNHNDWKLVIAATGNQTNDLKLLAEELIPKDAFEFIGFVGPQENAENYGKAKIWISIPFSDGTSISLLEAMGYGCIPVLSDLPANIEWVENNVNGVILKKEQLFAAFERALKLNGESVALMNINIIEDKATKMVNQKKFEDIYNKIINHD